jgi:hypothetical protein
MASRLKEVALILTSCALAWFLIGLMDLEKKQIKFPRVPGGDEVSRLRQDVSRLNNTLRRIAVVDTVDKLVRSGNSRLLLPVDSGFTPVMANAVHNAAGTDSVKAHVAVLVVHPNFHTTKEHRNFLGTAAAEFVVDSVNGQPFCAAVHYRNWSGEENKYERFTNEGERSRVLGPCAFFVRYGAPGLGVSTWLEGGGSFFADAPAHYVMDREWQQRTNRKLFGMRPMYYGSSLMGDSCLSGRDSACSKAVLDARTARWWARVEALPEGPLTFPRYFDNSELFGEADRAMVAQLEAEFGAVKFQKFWQSNQPVEQAFNAAFGMSLDAWVRSWGIARYGPEPMGPKVEWLTLLLSFVTIGIMVGIALLIVQRRAVR